MISAEGLAEDILKKDKGKEDEPESDSVESAIGEAIDLMASKDKAGAAKALRAAVEMCMREYSEDE